MAIFDVCIYTYMYDHTLLTVSAYKIPVLSRVLHESPCVIIVDNDRFLLIPSVQLEISNVCKASYYYYHV